MVLVRYGRRLGLALALLGVVGFPISSLAAVAQQNGGHRTQRRLAQNRQQPPDWVNDVFHCSNPQQINFIESDVFCNPSTFQWDLSVLEPFAHPGFCNRVNYTEIYELSFIQGALTDFQKPCYWWNLMYGSMAPSSSPSTSTPSTNPTMVPSNSPSMSPTMTPSFVPSDFPTGVPSLTPTSLPTSVPSVVPSTIPSTLAPSISPTLLPSAKPTFAPVVAPVKQTARPTSAPVKQTSKPTSKPTSRPVSLRPTTYETTYSPTLTSYPTELVTTFSPTIASTLDRNGVLSRPLANFVIAYSVGASGSLRRGRAQRHLLSVNRYQLTALTATYLIEQLKTAFPNSQVKTVALVLTSVTAEVSVAHNASTNTSTSSSTFQEALSGEVIFGTTQTSLVPVLHDLYDSIQNSFTDSQALKTYFRILQGSRDPVLKRISRVNLVQGVSYVNTTTSTDTPSNATSSNVTAQTNQGFKWSVTLIAIVAGAGVATLGVAFLVYLCITHKSRKRRRRLRKQQREQRQKEALKAREAEKARKSAAAAERSNRASSRPSALDTSNNTKTTRRRWFSWGGGDRSTPDLALQATSSVNSSPLSMITTPRTTSDSPVKTTSAVAAQPKRRTVKDFDELVSDDGNDDECFRSAADEDQSEVTSTYSYIETNTNDEHSISVAPSFLYGPNETGSIMGDYDDFGELVGAATKRIHRTPWIDDLNLQSKAAAWTSVNSKKASPLPPSRNASAPPILKAGKANILSSPAPTQASLDPNNSHLLDISESYGSFYEYDEKKGIMIISRPVEDPIPIDGDMPSKIGTSFAMEDSFFSQEGSQTDAMIVMGDKGEVSALGSPSRMPGMDSGGSLFLNSPSTSFSTSSPRKAPVSARNQQPSVSVDEQAIGEVLQFYEGTTSATSTSTTPSPVKAKKFAFGEVWRDIVEEDVDDHVRDTTSVSSQGRSPASQRKVVTNDASPSLSRKLNRSDGSVHSTSSLSQRAASKEASSSPSKDGTFQTLNRSDASPRKKSTPNGSKGTDPSYYLHSPDKRNRSESSSRMSLTPGSSKSASSSPADRFDDYADDEDFQQGARVSFSTLNHAAGTRQPASPSNEAKSHETTTRRWLASQANEQKSDVKPQSRSRSVAPPAGQRQRGPTATSTMPSTKRSSSLPPSRHASLHRVKEGLPLANELKNWSPREHRIDEATSGDDVGAKLSI